jgi:DNA-binding CsgD family transcriptional regulator
LALRLRGRRAECEFLDAVLADALAGRSRAVVLRGEAGAGKSSLLSFVLGHAADWRVASARGVESEMELAYGGLHQLCAPMLDHLDRLPTPQRAALATVFGYEAGSAPDRFMIGLATLTLFAEVAEEQPLLCVIDDVQWLDDASAQVVLFVARRLLAERIALVCAGRTGIGDGVFAGLAALPVTGLGDSDARALLLDNLHGPIDAAVCEQLLTESHGNPLALLELPRTWSSEELAGGFGIPVRQPVVSKIEQSYAKRLLLLPDDTRLLVLVAAAEPVGDPMLLHRAAQVIGLDPAASGPAVDERLLDVSGRIEFAHPLVRSAAYGTASDEDRQRVHRALAEATDPEKDADRRAWHLARATRGPDEDVAAELERSAERAQSRGGVAATAAFLERAAALTPEPAKRGRRALAAAEAKQLAGAPQAASRLLVVAEDALLDDLESALAERLRGRVAFALRRSHEAVPFLLDAARRLESIQPDLARETYLEALQAATISGRLGSETLRQAAEAARRAAPSVGAPRALDLLLDGLGTRFTDGYAASAQGLQLALQAVCEEGNRSEQHARWPWYARRVAHDLLDAETGRVLSIRSVRLARDRGALGTLTLALGALATMHTVEGSFDAAEGALDESDAIDDAIGEARIGSGRLALAGLRGDETLLSRLAEAAETEATTRGEGVVFTYIEHARAILYNGLGLYESALPAAESASARDELGASVRSLPELVEAATRCGKAEVAIGALERLTARTEATGTDWALGLEARSRALLAVDEQADELYVEAIDRLGRCRVAPEQARAYLLHGEWLRRAGRRVDARKQLRVAHDMLAAIGMGAFAERTRRELAATGEKVRRRRPETRDELTAQEMQIAQLACSGHSNPEIGAQLFLSPRTVEWHLRKVFGKLGISSRRELDAALPDAAMLPALESG